MFNQSLQMDNQIVFYIFVYQLRKLFEYKKNHLLTNKLYFYGLSCFGK